MRVVCCVRSVTHVSPVIVVSNFFLVYLQFLVQQLCDTQTLVVALNQSNVVLVVN